MAGRVRLLLLPLLLVLSLGGVRVGPAGMAPEPGRERAPAILSGAASQAQAAAEPDATNRLGGTRGHPLAAGLLAAAAVLPLGGWRGWPVLGWPRQLAGTAATGGRRSRAPPNQGTQRF